MLISFANSLNPDQIWHFIRAVLGHQTACHSYSKPEGNFGFSLNGQHFQPYQYDRSWNFKWVSISADPDQLFLMKPADQDLHCYFFQINTFLASDDFCRIADNLCKSFRSRSGPTFCLACFGSKLVVFPKAISDVLSLCILKMCYLHQL